MAVLIHELTHVWQAEQSGGIYMIEALWSQFFGRGYELTEDDLHRAANKIDRLEREQQAVLIEMYWKAEFGGRPISLPIDLVRPLARSMLARQAPDESNSLPFDET
jgi:hypothetical protein